jgi:hypothetical protein
MTGLIPILKEMHNPWFMQFFSEEAKLRHATSKWDAKTRSAVPAEEVELDGFLTEDNEMNQTEVSILKPASRTPEVEICRPVVAELESFPKCTMIQILCQCSTQSHRKTLPNPLHYLPPK